MKFTFAIKGITANKVVGDKLVPEVEIDEVSAASEIEASEVTEVINNYVSQAKELVKDVMKPGSLEAFASFAERFMDIDDKFEAKKKQGQQAEEESAESYLEKRRREFKEIIQEHQEARLKDLAAAGFEEVPQNIADIIAGVREEAEGSINARDLLAQQREAEALANKESGLEESLARIKFAQEHGVVPSIIAILEGKMK